MNVITKLDEFLLMRVFTMIAHKWEHLTGQTNFRLAWYAYNMVGVASLIGILLSIMTQLWPLVLCYSSMAFINIRFVNQAMRADRDSKKMLTTIPPAVAWFQVIGRLRSLWLGFLLALVLMLFLAPVVLLDYVNLAFGLGNFLGTYFGCVLRPPPKRQEYKAPSGAVWQS